MKSDKSMCAALAALLALCWVATVEAGTPISQTASLAAGSGTYTNNREQQILKLEVIELFATDPASATATVVRVQDNLTNTVATIVCASGVGRYNETNTTYVFKSGQLRVSAAGTNTGTMRVTGQLLP